MKRAALTIVAASFLGIRAVLAAEAPENFVVHDSPKVVSEVKFQNGDGRQLTLADFRGRVVLLNIWATWCAPCRIEMPTLDHLQAALGGPHFEVVALSIDRAGAKAVTRFYAEIGVKHLAMYIDSSGKAARALGALGLPTTLLIDLAGREIGRVVGPAEWDAPPMVAFIRGHVAERSGATAEPGRSIALTEAERRTSIAAIVGGETSAQRRKEP